MKETSYKDKDGRYWAVQLPNGAPNSDARLGLPLGPPSLKPLKLPKAIEVRLHNQLFHRRIFTEKDVRTRKMEIFGALQAALKIDIRQIEEIYYNDEESGDSS